MKICDSNQCVGCGVCSLICPQKCIKMEADFEGFLRPIIENGLCIECGKCKKNCPALIESTYSGYLDQPIVYALKNRDHDILEKSTSGGMFSALACNVIQKGGAVFGCILDEQFNAKHTIAEKNEELTVIRGSKYIQSNLGDIFNQAERILKDGRWVLFTGTPCQIAGLKTYLRDDFEKLITVDLICHGVPSNLLFHKYLTWLEERLGGKLFEYHFRDKTRFGWGNFGSYKYIKNDQIYLKYYTAETDYFFNLYLAGSIYRESCYRCKYAKPLREGDFTIADYWGIERYHPEFYPPDGVSLVILNTQKAKSFFDGLSSEVVSVESKMEYAKVENKNLSKPVNRPNVRDTLYKDINQYGFLKTVKKQVRLKRVTPWIKRMISYKYKARLRKIHALVTRK